MEIKIQKRHLEEFIQCEYGAHEDEMTGPSPFTTVTILQRNKTLRAIVINTAEEAAQVADAANYGTFSHMFENVAGRIYKEALVFPGAKEILIKWDKECWESLGNQIEETKANA